MNLPLAPEHVRDFGLSTLGPLLGAFPGRVFLAGGAFKTLLHGRPPRDLDLWAPSAEDRLHLIDHLVARGAEPRPRHAYSDVLEYLGQEIEIPDAVEPPVLEDRLARFDLALSAVGVEWDAGRVRPSVHPLALKAVSRREILLLRPLVNWKHVLGTLARAHRYAAELGWPFPAEEEAAAWALFESQDLEEQARMVERYRSTAIPDARVLAEGLGRMKGASRLRRSSARPSAGGPHGAWRGSA